jgi:hypothetical protein
VVAVNPSRLAVVGARKLSNHPFVDNAAAWRDSRFDRRYCVFLWDLEIDSWLGIGIISAFARFLVCEAHGVHSRVVLGKVVHKQYLN